MCLLYISSNLNDHCSDRCYNRNVLFCYCIRYGRHSDTKAGYRWKTQLVQNITLLRRKKYMLNQNTEKKRIPQVSCWPHSQIWRRKKMPEAGDWHLLSSSCTPAHQLEQWLVFYWEDQVSVLLVSGWFTLEYKKIHFKEERNGFSIGKTFQQIVTYMFYFLFTS